MQDGKKSRTAAAVVTRLSRVGYDNTLGYLKGGINSWKNMGKEIAYIKELSAENFAKIYDENFPLLDVRKESEYDSQHIEGAENFPLDFINKNMDKVDRNTQYYLHCQGGYRSVITASILKARGFDKLVNIKGGFDALKQTQLPLTKYHEPVTML